MDDEDEYSVLDQPHMYISINITLQDQIIIPNYAVKSKVILKKTDRRCVTSGQAEGENMDEDDINE